MLSRIANTYTILAVDQEREEMGIATQSHVFGVGSIVPWAEAGVGVVATQSLVNTDLGPRGLALLREGMEPTAAVEALVASDPGQEYRQFALLRPDGTLAVHTGERCIREAGDASGTGVVAMANMMERPTVWEAMITAFGDAEGSVARRLLAAMRAAEAEGGDIRGKQSAAMIVVSTKRRRTAEGNRLLDLRVEDHASPVEEMGRLVRLHEAYSHANAADEALAAGDIKAAESSYADAFALAPECAELRYWMALGLATAGEVDRAKEMLRPLYAVAGGWRELTMRLKETGLFDLNEEAWESLSTG